MNVASASRLTWFLPDLNGQLPTPRRPLVEGIDQDWAWGGSWGAGVRVCILDSGIEPGHPLVGEIADSFAVVPDDAGVPQVIRVESEDRYGHGTACASVVRRVAPECEIHSVRVLGERGAGTAATLAAALEWAIEQRYEVISLSLSTTRRDFDQRLRELADEACFHDCALVASAHNSRVESFPWRFSTVISVGSHGEQDLSLVVANPTPPVEFFAPGRAVPVAALGGGSTRNTGNSFATPHISGLCALILAKHGRLPVFELKTVLHQTSANITGD